MKIDKSSTTGFLFGYFVIAKIFLGVLGMFPFPNLLYLLFDANIGIMVSLLWGSINYKLKENERIRKGVFKRKDKG